MTFRYLGTAAAEGIPALLCNCENCQKSRRAGGRALRTRSQAILNNELLLDFPADSYGHFLTNQIDLLSVKCLLVTHSHQDHLYPEDFAMFRPGFSHVPEGWSLPVYASAKCLEALTIQQKMLQDTGIVTFHPVEAFAPFDVAGYQVVALPSIHDTSSGPLFYQISREGKTLLYAHDTHYFDDSVWAYWKKTGPHFSFVSLDCTNACLPLTYVGHMGLAENISVRDRMIREGYADENTRFVLNHFSHNGISVAYDDFVPIAAKENFSVSYDSMEILF